MQNPTPMIPKALRLTAVLSLALLPCIQVATAQSTLTKVVQLSTGTDDDGVALAIGSNDLDISQVPSTLGMIDYASALASSQTPQVVQPHSVWIPSLPSNPAARWIHSNHDPLNGNGSGALAESVLYAQGFELSLTPPRPAKHHPTRSLPGPMMEPGRVTSGPKQGPPLKARPQ